MKYFEYPILYLELSDFDESGNIVNDLIPTHKNIIVMVQASYCSHCTIVKPTFQKLANSNPDIVFCTVQGDATESEKDAAKLLMGATKTRGYPSFVKFNNKKLDPTLYSGSRTAESLLEFARK